MLITKEISTKKKGIKKLLAKEFSTKKSTNKFFKKMGSMYIVYLTQKRSLMIIDHVDNANNKQEFLISDTIKIQLLCNILIIHIKHRNKRNNKYAGRDL